MEIVEDIVIVGAGIAGLATALGLHRLGMPSLVLESSDTLRTTGFAIMTWNNAWKALDAIGVGDSLRRQHKLVHRLVAKSTVSRATDPLEIPCDESEARCLKRSLMVEALAKELPNGTIRFSSKAVSIEESGHFKLLHLADGTILKTKVLIGCDGVNSVVAKWLGLSKPVFTGRSGTRAYAHYKDGHGFEPEFQQFFGNGFRSGFLPCDDRTVYWFWTWSPSTQEKVMENEPAKLKQLALNKLQDLPDRWKAVVENTQLDSIISTPLRYRRPWELLWRNISKGNVCVAGDALHATTPDIGQGGCSALEDAVVLARCLGEALLKPSRKEEWKRIDLGLKKYAEERRWRSFELISAAYTVGTIQQGNGLLTSFLRDKVLFKFLLELMLGKASYDCGKLIEFLE